MRYFVLSYFVLQITFFANAQSEILSIKGEWHVRLDSLDKGEREKWFNDSSGMNIHLPGTLDEAGLGRKSQLIVQMQRPIVDQLTRKYSYIGAAWYSREVLIPESWRQEQLFLFLERVIWKTDVWIDDKKMVESNESLVAPHVFNLTTLTPGKHRITVRVDNRKQHDISLAKNNFAHAYTEGTQIIWNGILGKIELIKIAPIHIASMQVYAMADSAKIRIVVELDNINNIKGKIAISVSVPELIESVPTPVVLSGNKSQRISLSLPVDKNNISLWDEFNPKVYNALVTISAKYKGKKIESQTTTSFGFRKLTTNNSLLQLNGRRLFLRGTLECAIFPLTGYPPLNEISWEKVFTTAKHYGLNHIRFHSWCPPEEAFTAADKLGIYLQVELPLWSLTTGLNERDNQYLKDEADRIIQYYGNHPSFMFWSMGNELEGNFDWINSLVADLKTRDSRRLYTATTFSFQNGHGKWPEKNDDYFITQYTRKGWVRGQGVFDSMLPNFNKDYSEAVDSIHVPIIAHEIGQYSVYPNMAELKKYTGVLSPLNLLAVQKDLEQKNMSHLAGVFTEATGKFATQLYKEEIERALKTKGFSGFQLLDLHDFPGQGTAMVGILDAFWDSKGFISENEFRQFCAPVVPLIRFPKAVYTTNEKFTATIEVANFGASAIAGEPITWKLTNEEGNSIAAGTIPPVIIPIGNGRTIGEIESELNTITSAQKLRIEVRIGDKFMNHWNIWVYPLAISNNTGNVLLTRNFKEASTALAQGRNVLLIPELKQIKGIEGKFVPVFWSPVHFPDQPGTMGILVDPGHHVFSSFPTEPYSTWNWWDINKNSVVIKGYDPLIRIIDNFYKNRELGILYEFKSNKGKLMLCTADLLSQTNERPVARQLLYSILNYMNSSNFTPEHELPSEFLKAIEQ